LICLIISGDEHKLWSSPLCNFRVGHRHTKSFCVFPRMFQTAGGKRVSSI
jgi:hypothetical protein